MESTALGTLVAGRVLLARPQDLDDPDPAELPDHLALDRVPEALQRIEGPSMGRQTEVEDVFQLRGHRRANS